MSGPWRPLAGWTLAPESGGEKSVPARNPAAQPEARLARRGQMIRGRRDGAVAHVNHCLQPRSSSISINIGQVVVIYLGGSCTPSDSGHFLLLLTLLFPCHIYATVGKATLAP